MRPTAHIVDDEAEILCFPGIDYVFHFSNIYSSFASLVDSSAQVICELPDESTCWNEIYKSSLNNIPKTNTVIMGYVEGLEYLSSDNVWLGNGNFLYKRIHTKSGEAILLGCKHTYWGEIAGRIITYLASLGVRRVIYCGKLGTLKSLYVPNKTIATGNTSLLPNGEIITWNNLFELNANETIKCGKHITIPSILQETKSWVSISKTKYAYVDPEIGHMANAAQKSNIHFSYLHIVSDNLSQKYLHDLSNERKNEVILDRKNLMQIIGNIITNL